MNTLYLLFCQVNKIDIFVDSVLTQMGFSSIQDFCLENDLYYELCRAALKMNKTDKFNEYIDDVKERDKILKLNHLMKA